MIHPRRALPVLLTSIVSFTVMLSGLAQSSRQDGRGLAVQQSTGTAPDGRGKLWAVVIGISSYKNVPPEGQLRFAHRDAQELAAFLRTPSGGGFPANHIKLLLNQDATLSAIRTAIGTWLVRSVEPDDVVYVFFAGHGVVEGERDGYLLAHDSDPQNLYATALQVAELDRIISERLRARIVVLMADACHAGQIGWTSRGAPEISAINLYLDEVGKSGAGVFRLLASRANERSFEDTRWGGGHGAFTHFLLEGLRGKADRDKDGFVRVSELLDFLSEVVPEQTQALQHPRMAGSIDPRLPLSVLARERLREATNVATSTAPLPSSLTLEVRGVPGSDVYVDNAFRGKIRPNGILVIQDLIGEQHEISVDQPNAGSFSRNVTLTAARTVLDLKASAAETSTKVAAAAPPPGKALPKPELEPVSTSKKNAAEPVVSPPKTTPLPEPASVSAKPASLIAQINQAIARKAILEPGGAWPLYQQLVRERPSDPQRSDVEIALSSALEEIGQQAINGYVRSSVLELKAVSFKRGAEAYTRLRALNPGDSQLEAKQLFCEARVAIDESRNKEAVAALKKAITLDPKAGYVYNALGVAYEKERDDDKAQEAFKRAAELAPQWSFPRLHLAIQHQARGKPDRAEEEFLAAVRLDPRDPFMRWWLVRHYRQRGQFADGEKVAFELIKLAPKFASVYVELGSMYEAAKIYDKAAACYEAFLKLAPTAVDAQFTGYDQAAIREAAAKNRKQANKKQPSLKKK